jgi:hypothetical protein
LVETSAAETTSRAPTYRDILFNVLQQTASGVKVSIAAEHVVKHQIEAFWKSIEMPTQVRSSMVDRVTNLYLNYLRLRKDNYSKKRSKNFDRRVIEFTSNFDKVFFVPPKGRMDALKPIQQEILQKLELNPKAIQAGDNMHRRMAWGVQKSRKQPFQRWPARRA